MLPKRTTLYDITLLFNNPKTNSQQELKDNDKIFVNLFSTGGLDLKAQSVINYKENFEKLTSDYNNWVKEGKRVYFYLSNNNEKKKITLM